MFLKTAEASMCPRPAAAHECRAQAVVHRFPVQAAARNGAATRNMSRRWCAKRSPRRRAPCALSRTCTACSRCRTAAASNSLSSPQRSPRPQSPPASPRRRPQRRQYRFRHRSRRRQQHPRSCPRPRSLRPNPCRLAARCFRRCCSLRTRGTRRRRHDQCARGEGDQRCSHEAFCFRHDMHPQSCTRGALLWSTFASGAGFGSVLT